MAWRTSSVLFLLLAGSLAGCIRVELGDPQALDTPVGSPDDGLTTLSVAIVDSATDRPLAGAEVKLSIAGLGSLRKTTDSEGRVTFTIAPAASCTVQVTRSGYESRTDPLKCGADQAYRIPLKASKSSGGGGGGSSATATGSSAPRPTTTSAPRPPGNGTGGEPGENGTDEGNETEPRPFEPEEPDGTCGSLDSLTPVPPNPVLVPGLATGWPLLEVTMAVVVDPAFADAHPDDWRPLIEDLVADSSALFEDQIGVRLNLTLVARLPDGSLEPGSGDGQQRATARGYMKANHPRMQPDLVAVILGADYEGTTAGMVECVHGAGYPDYAYLWAEYTDPRGPSTFFGSVGMFDDIPLKVLTHETGHLFAAHHHYSNCGEALAGFSSQDALGVCDIMINDVGLASFQFGPTNRLVMRSYVEQIGIGDPV